MSSGAATSLDQLPHMLAAWKLFGHQAMFTVPDIDRTQFFLCLGGGTAAFSGVPVRVRAHSEAGVELAAGTERG